MRKDKRVRYLEEVILDLERHSAEGGWDAPPRLYALVETAQLRHQEPDLAEQLGIPADVDSIAAALERALGGRGVDFEHAVPALLARFSWAASVQHHLDAYRRFLAKRALLTH